MSEGSIIGPCPVPRCGLELHLGATLVVIGAYLLIASDASLVIKSLMVENVPLSAVRWFWAVVLTTAGLSQIAAILIYQDNRGLHRTTAGVCMGLMTVFAVAQFANCEIPVLAGVSVLVVISELIVFALLRGAKWRNS